MFFKPTLTKKYFAELTSKDCFFIKPHTAGWCQKSGFDTLKEEFLKNIQKSFIIKIQISIFANV